MSPGAVFGLDARTVTAIGCGAAAGAPASGVSAMAIALNRNRADAPVPPLVNDLRDRKDSSMTSNLQLGVGTAQSAPRAMSRALPVPQTTPAMHRGPPPVGWGARVRCARPLVVVTHPAHDS